MKTCNVCKVEKSVVDFHPDKSGKDGYRTICKVCTNDRVAQKRNLRKEGVGLILVSSKRCNKCLETKAIDEFFKDIANSDGHYSMCKVCKTKKTMEWRAEHTDKYNKSQREYSKSNPEMRYGV